MRRPARLAFNADLCPKAHLLPSTHDPRPWPSASDTIAVTCETLTQLSGGSQEQVMRENGTQGKGD